ncbi:MAG: [FeFe] hydrogenase H-cluster maturation GTPase HydF [Enterocloster sp.]|nr:[FeFe] hydrogenase H-cluster maturation GTPase HydF [Enterocloster sp.]
MGMNETPSGERIHISFFGRRNAGKSSVLNAVIGQELAVVSDVKGTTTDPVYKSMELLPLGPVTVIDTPGIDDEGELGALRVRKSYQVLNKTDIAVIVVDSQTGFGAEEEKLLNKIKDKQIPCIVVFNKIDRAVCPRTAPENIPVLAVSARTKEGITELKETIAKAAKTEAVSKPLVADLLNPSDFVVLVVPIDKAAPKGRLILPQQQTIRDILEAGAVSIVVKDNELKNTLENIGKKPKLVITDSQAFGKVSKDTPEDILLTSFSILFARYKGELETMISGVAALNKIKTGDKILISEGCTHHRQCGDIGTVKLPHWICQFTKSEPEFTFTSGTEFPDDLDQYKLIIHCGGCMLNGKEMKYRIKCACDQNVPITNYGMTIAYIHGVLERSLEPFPQAAALLYG